MLNYLKIKEIADRKSDLSSDLSEEYLLANGIRVIVRPMAYEIKGIVTPYGSIYQIAINERVPDDQKWIALLHELYHIANNDFDRSDSVEDIEAENPF